MNGVFDQINISGLEELPQQEILAFGAFCWWGAIVMAYLRIFVFRVSFLFYIVESRCDEPSSSFLEIEINVSVSIIKKILQLQGNFSFNVKNFGELI